MTMTLGYERLIAAGSSLTGLEVFASETEPSNLETDEFLTANRESLEQARLALQLDCCLPLEYEESAFERRCQGYSPIRNLARSFGLELNALARHGCLKQAVDVGLVVFDLANAVRNGGLMTDLLVAIAIEGLAIERLRGFRRQLEPDAAIHLANGLLQNDDLREPFAAIAARDSHWEQVVHSPDEEIDFDSTEWPEEDDDEMDQEAVAAIRQAICEFAKLPEETHRAIQRQLDDRELAMIRLLAIESALIAFHARHGTYPQELSPLVPECIAAVPSDPFTGKAFKYRTTNAGYVVYSPGPTGRDSGGTFGGWFSVEAGQADLCLDMNDHEDTCCCAIRPRPTLGARLKAFLTRLFRR
jgi:hypothetical protein